MKRVGGIGTCGGVAGTVLAEEVVGVVERANVEYAALLDRLERQGFATKR